MQYEYKYKYIVQWGEKMAIVNFKLEGELEDFVHYYIKSGLATSKTEVLRLGLLRLKDHYHESLAQRPAHLILDEHDKSIR